MLQEWEQGVFFLVIALNNKNYWRVEENAFYYFFAKSEMLRIVTNKNNCPWISNEILFIFRREQEF